MPDARILILTGKGRGKTTSAVGTAVRAAGHGVNVFIMQFIKNRDDTGESLFCAGVDTIDIEQGGLGFVPSPGTPAWERHRCAAADALTRAREAVAAGRYGMIVLDEVCTAVSLQLLAAGEVLAFIRSLAPDMIAVLTGRDCPPSLSDAADTVSEIDNVKHGLDSGIRAQKGVEY